jgi:hypothetical protein
MNTYKCFEIDNSIGDCSEISGNFDVYDDKGRVIGYKIYLMSVKLIAHKEGYIDMPEGKCYAFYPQATRDGKKYGAGQSTRFFATEEERSKAIDEYISSAFKRNKNKFGLTEGVKKL